jgi:hypothetical protein
MVLYLAKEREYVCVTDKIMQSRLDARQMHRALAIRKAVFEEKGRLPGTLKVRHILIKEQVVCP